jgi:NAD(P)-dependent dehydrogenase (short-subunit alcohol dehydrogenase family)
MLDVTDTRRCAVVVEEVAARFGRIDVLVNNAGRTQVGALEETTERELRDLFDLHFFGPAVLTRAVLPHMRRASRGTVVQMSSVGGQITAPGFGAYCATKFALEGLTQTLSQEVDFGVTFLIVEPGAFRTGLFNPGAAYTSKPIPEYAATVGPTRQYLRSGDGTQPGDPAKAAQAILTALDAPNPPLRWPCQPRLAPPFFVLQPAAAGARRRCHRQHSQPPGIPRRGTGPMGGSRTRYSTRLLTWPMGTSPRRSSALEVQPAVTRQTDPPGKCDRSLGYGCR